MVAMRTNLFATPSLSPRGYVLILVKDRRGMMGIYWIFFTRHKRFLDDVCSYGSFENIYAGLQLFMVDVRTNLFGVRNAKSTRGYDAGKDQRGMMGMDWIFFHTSQTFFRWYIHIWKLRKYLRGSTIIHGSHTHQSVRNAKSTRGYVRADAKGQRGMMGIDWNFHTSQTFRRYCALIRKLCKYLCAPANITENTVAISQRFHVRCCEGILTNLDPLFRRDFDSSPIFGPINLCTIFF